MTLNAMLTRLKPSKPVAQYQVIAEIYDAMMTHVEYDTWADYIMHVLDLYHPDGLTLTDAGCGTGSMMLHLQNHGFSVSGFDLSFEMAKKAKEKTGAPVWQGDLLACPLVQKQDVILCLYDTMQYLSEKEIQSCLSQIRENLQNDGIFIYDLVTEAHVLRYWADVTEKDNGENWEMVRRSWFDRSNMCQHSELEIMFPEQKQRFHEHHRQWIYSLETWKRLCAEGGFEILAMLEDFSMDTGSEDSDRIHFILKRG